MKNILLILLSLFFSLSANSQLWTKSFEMGQSLARSENKLMVVDFWATWCGPCKNMDKTIWSDKEVIKAMDNFIPVKIDVDRNREIAERYGIKSIPAVFIMDYKGNIMYKYRTTPNTYALLNKLKEYPSNVKAVYDAMDATEAKKTILDSLLNADKLIKMEMTNASDLYRSYLVSQNKVVLKKARKTCGKKESIMLEKLELLELHTEVLDKHSNKAIKLLVEKQELDNINDANYQLACQILADAYLNIGNKEESDRYAKIYRDINL